MKLFHFNLTTVIITFILYNLEGSYATELNSIGYVFGKNVDQFSESISSSEDIKVPVRILTDSSESIKSPIINMLNTPTKQTDNDTDNHSKIEIDLFMDVQPIDSSLSKYYNNGVKIVEQRSGFDSKEIKEPNPFDNINHDTDDIDYEEDDDIDTTEDEYLLKKNKFNNDINPSRRTLAYHGDVDVKGRSGIPETRNLKVFKLSSPYLPAFTAGYASNGPRRSNRNENAIHYTRMPQYFMFPAQRKFYIPPSYSHYLPLVTHIRKFDNTEMIIPKTKYSKTSGGRSTVESVEVTTKNTLNEIKLNDHETNSYPYEPLRTSEKNNNTKHLLENSLIFKKLVESSRNPKPINLREESPNTDIQTLPIQNGFQRNHKPYNSPL